MQTPRLSLQMWSIRKEMQQDPEVTFRQIRGLGYDGIETAGDHGWSIEYWKELLGETKLSIVGAHIGLEALESDFDRIIRFQSALGNTRIVVPSVPKQLQNPSGYSEAATRLNTLGASCSDAGMQLFYHNHAFEFDLLADGSAGMSTLLSNTDPSLVRFEFDTYWLERGGENALAFLRHHAAQTGMIHAKELRRADLGDVPAGEGDIEFPAILALARENHWPVVVEFEGGDALAAVAKSAAYLSPLL